ncbi:MAG: LysR family transcriptional regulator [Acinetobacter calcoaceticus]
MDTRKIDLNLLLTLEALLAEQNVTKAAVRLHLSQPAVSAQLSRLREVFKDPLFIPGQRGITPTAKALELMAQLGDPLEKIRHTVQSHEEFNPKSTSLTLTLSGTDYVQVAVIMPLVLALQKLAPQIRIAIRNYDPSQFEYQLAVGKIDAVIATPDTIKPHLRTHHLFDETYVLVGRPDHPKLRKNLTMDEFSKLRHVIVSPSGGEFTTPIDQILMASGLQREVVMSAASFLSIPGIVSMSDLVALVPRRLIQEPFNHLSVIELPWLNEYFNVSMIWHERNHAHAGHRWLRDLIISLNKL